VEVFDPASTRVEPRVSKTYRGSQTGIFHVFLHILKTYNFVCEIFVNSTILFIMNIHNMRNRDGAVGVTTGYGLDNGGVGVRVPVG
jgi:hypothetical protein